MERFARRRLAYTGFFIFTALLFVLLLYHYPPSPSAEGLRAVNAESGAAEYVQRLATVRPGDVFQHSRTLGVADALYMVSLARRTDRREHMEKLAHALDIQFTYIDATDFSGGEGKAIIDDLAKRVRWQRNHRIDEEDARPADWPIDRYENTDGGFLVNAFPFKWSPDAINNHDNPLQKPIGISGADHWDLDHAWIQTHPIPPFNATEKADEELMCSSSENAINVRERLKTSAIACWHSHMLALREVIKNQNKVSIIFEDDIDVEWDLEKRLHLMWDNLPMEWDIIYLGHCFSKEHAGAFVPKNAILHKSSYALCTHAYALSLSGATRLYRYLRSADYAYTRPLDHAIRELVEWNKIKSYSVFPPFVIQTKGDLSDVVGNDDLGWRPNEDLIDSTMERIRLFEAQSSEPLLAMNSQGGKKT